MQSLQGRSRTTLSNVPAKNRQLPTVSSDVAMFIGVAEWGPFWTPTIVCDYGDYYEKFGGLLASYDMALQVKTFFDMGGRRAVIIRVCHVTNHAASATPATAVKSTYNFKTAVGGGYSAVDTLTITALYYGLRGNDIKIKITPASNGDITTDFDLYVYVDDVLKEWFPNVNMDSTSSQYVEAVVNNSKMKSVWITATDLDISTSAADKIPSTTLYATTATALAAGNDGLTGLVVGDYIGAVTYNTGLYGFNLEAEGDMLCCPDMTTTTFQNAATSYCAIEKKGKVLFMTDAPEATDKAGVRTHNLSLTASESRTKILWPWIKIANPDTTVYGIGDTVTIAPSAAHMGRMSKNTQSEKSQMWVQPSNEVYGLLDVAVGLENITVREPTVQDYVTDNGCNPVVDGIRGIDGNYGVWVNDCLLGMTSGNITSIGAYRGTAFLRKKFELYLERHRTQNNSGLRRQDVKDAFDAELMGWTEKGAFLTTNVPDAFYVNTDPEGVSLNNPIVQQSQTFNILVGIAYAEPGRFINLMFTKDTRAVESYIMQQMAQNT